MAQHQRDPQPPRGFSAFLYRLPIGLYRIGLGWLFGARFVLINHVGRRSGKLRRAVVEIVDKDRKADRYVVVSAWGEKAQWYQNIVQHPDVTIQVGARRIDAHARLMPVDEARQTLIDYVARYPKLAPELMRAVGYTYDGTPEGFADLARDKMRLVEFPPRPS